MLGPRGPRYTATVYIASVCRARPAIIRSDPADLRARASRYSITDREEAVAALGGYRR